MLISVMVTLLFLVSCAPEKPLTDEELQAELAKLSPEELEAVTAEDKGALAGKATQKFNDPNLLRLQRAYRSRYTGTAAPKPNTCSDNDADTTYPTGLNPFKKGTASWTSGSESGSPTDACSNENELRENYCLGNFRKDALVKCSEVGPQYFPGTTGWKCVDGACKPSPMNVSMNQTKPQNVSQPTPQNVTMNQTSSKGDVCGNGVKNATEQCDDGNTADNDLCGNDCKLPVCGDKSVEGAEQCDDGNTVDGDGCSATCKVVNNQDLTVEKITYESDQQGPNIIKVTALVKNIGTGSTSNFGTGTKFVPLQPQGVNLTVATSPLGAGDQTLVTTSYKCNQNHQVQVWADANGNEAESNETNNNNSVYVTC